MSAHFKSAEVHQRTNGAVSTGYAAIGNGLYAPTRRRLSLFEEYRAKQATCAHEKRDPRGVCYECGHQEAK